MQVTVRSAGVVVVRETGRGFLYLLLRAYANWDFPKGEIEVGEQPVTAAIREVREETTVDDLSFRWGEHYRETVPYNGKIARYYVATTLRTDISLPVNPNLGYPEHHEFRWASCRAARNLVPPRLVPILDWAQETVSDHRDY